MDRVLQTHTFGPHRVDVVEYPDDEGGGMVAVLIDDVMVTDPPLPGVPTMDDLMHIYATWRAVRP
ncbi:MAG: hypothetical protein MUF35_08245 [Candidatus Nanopelagicales bacterium]|jgi:hypothetical protein|nr:hypothetical protein [Candidatus Nanopelagicales bacterium]